MIGIPKQRNASADAFIDCHCSGGARFVNSGLGQLHGKRPTMKCGRHGIDPSLGLTLRNVMRLVFQHGMTPVFVGIVAGILTASVFSKAMNSLLFKTSALDLSRS
jgi:hypothetical protein